MAGDLKVPQRPRPTIPVPGAWREVEFAGLEPVLTHGEAGLLLGLSDHAAYRLERSAIQKLKSLAQRLNLRSPEMLDELNEDDLRLVCSEIAGSASDIEENPYTAKTGWYPLTSVKEISCTLLESVDLVLAFSFLRRSVGVVVRAPVLEDVSKCRPFGLGGVVDSLVRYRTQVYYRATTPGGQPRDFGLPGESTAIIDYLEDTDAAGPYAVPILKAVIRKPSQRP